MLFRMISFVLDIIINVEEKWKERERERESCCLIFFKK